LSCTWPPAGIRVAINYQSAHAAAEELVQTILSSGGEAAAFQADVSDPDQVKALFKDVSEKMGSVEVLVANAGVTRDNLLMRMKDEEWQKVLTTNLNSVYYCTREAIRPMMKARYGRIIAISSVVGLTGNAGQANYAAAKAGVLGLMKSLARELASRGITANSVAPGYIETDMTAVLPEEVRAAVLEKYRLRGTGNQRISPRPWRF
jgi:Dehydrogenases with different specificities (related to short-chain alcohol dehydrogenases)